MRSSPNLFFPLEAPDTEPLDAAGAPEAALADPSLDRPIAASGEDELASGFAGMLMHEEESNDAAGAHSHEEHACLHPARCRVPSGRSPLASERPPSGTQIIALPPRAAAVASTEPEEAATELMKQPGDPSEAAVPPALVPSEAETLLFAAPQVSLASAPVVALALPPPPVPAAETKTLIRAALGLRTVAEPGAAAEIFTQANAAATGAEERAAPPAEQNGLQAGHEPGRMVGRGVLTAPSNGEPGTTAVATGAPTSSRLNALAIEPERGASLRAQSNALRSETRFMESHEHAPVWEGAVPPAPILSAVSGPGWNPALPRFSEPSGDVSGSAESAAFDAEAMSPPGGTFAAQAPETMARSFTVIDSQNQKSPQKPPEGREAPSAATDTTLASEPALATLGRTEAAPTGREQFEGVAETHPSAPYLQRSEPAANVEPLRLGPSAAPGTRPADRLEEIASQMSQQVVEFRRLGLDTMTVVLRPDPQTELLLRLDQSGGMVNVQARFERGDFPALSAHWQDLQRTLGEQGVRLTVLETSGTGSGALLADQRGGFDGREPNEEPASPESVRQGTIPAPLARRMLSGHLHAAAAAGWESWA